MIEKEKKKESGEISRREFLKDAGLVVGGAAIASTVLLAACGDGEVTTETATKTVTTTAPGGTATVTTTVPGGTETVTTTAGAVTKTDTVTTTAGAVTKTVTESKFVCPIDSQEFDTLAALKSHFEAAHPSEAPAALNVVNLTVNGWAQKLQVTLEDTLRGVLRDKLGLTSIKEMCAGFGACGSCTVIMDHRPILSCMTLAIECDGAVVETAEGIADANHPLVEAYIMNHTMQCGYCTPGFIVTSKALLDHNPNPTEADIREILGGNICR